MIIAGIDEAGRGPVIGPMVVGIVAVEKDKESELVKVGAKDSKKVRADKRKKVYKEIAKISDWRVEYVAPEKIDEHGITKCEIDAIALLIENVNADIVYVDQIGALSEARFLDMMSQRGIDVEFVYRSKADLRFPVVGAASIMAKVCRDGAIRKIWKQIGNFSSGYPNKNTMDFIDKYYKEKG